MFGIEMIRDTIANSTTAAPRKWRGSTAYKEEDLWTIDLPEEYKTRKESILREVEPLCKALGAEKVDYSVAFCPPDYLSLVEFLDVYFSDNTALRLQIYRMSMTQIKHDLLTKLTQMFKRDQLSWVHQGKAEEPQDGFRECDTDYLEF